MSKNIYVDLQFRNASEYYECGLPNDILQENTVSLFPKNGVELWAFDAMLFFNYALNDMLLVSWVHFNVMLLVNSSAILTWP